MIKRFLSLLVMLPALLPASDYNYEPQPQKSALMIIAAHPDDEVYNFGGSITYYGVARKLPVILVSMTSEPALREDELRCAAWKYGIKNEPIFARFSNCCYGGTVEENWKEWGGEEKVVEYLTGLIRQYKPDVLLGHDLKGELRAHPNHICSALALIEAYRIASDPHQFPEQAKKYGTWQPKKLYLHLYPENSWIHNWQMTAPELGGKTVQETANEGGRCHVSQNVKGGCRNSEAYGLYATEVGPDVKKDNDFFENIDLTPYQSQTSEEKK